MKNKTMVWIGAGIVVVVLLYFFVGKDNGGGDGEYDAFAQCLTDSGATMYGTEWCSHCKEQKKRFGSSFEFVDYVDCDKNKDTCNAEGISGYPTWKINGESYPGTQQLTRLGELTGCEL